MKMMRDFFDGAGVLQANNGAGAVGATAANFNALVAPWVARGFRVDQ